MFSLPQAKEHQRETSVQENLPLYTRADWLGTNLGVGVGLYFKALKW